MNVLVTGGAGFIGSNLVRLLAGSGDHVVAVDNEYLGSFENLRGVDCVRVKADVGDGKRVDALVREHAIGRIVHLAGYTSAPMYDEDAPGKIRANFRQFLNVLEAARRGNVKVAYASTSSFYARCQKPFREDMTITPGTAYELSKLIMEQAAHTYRLQYGVSANGLRFFSVYGPHERHKARFANNVSQFLWSIRNGVRPVVFGDGSQTRDFTFVGDLVEAIQMVLERGVGSEVYNIGTGREYSFNTVIDMINEALGTAVPAVYVGNPLRNYVQATRADTSRARCQIGWKARTSLRDGVRRLVEANEAVSKEEAEGLYAWVRPSAVPAAPIRLGKH